MSHRPWSCLVCTLENPGSAQACEVCETKRPQPFHVRFRTPWELFTLEVRPSTSVEELRVLLESRCQLPAAQQRLYFGQPRKELLNGTGQTVGSILEVEKKGEEVQTITVEIRGQEQQRTTARGAGSAATLASMPIATEDDFIAWLEQDLSSVQSLAALCSSSSSSSSSHPRPPAAPSTAPSTSAEMDDVEDDDWGSAEGGDDWGDCDLDEEEEIDSEVTKAKHAAEQRSEGKTMLLQSSSNNTKLGVYERLTLRTVFDMQKQRLTELQEALGCMLSEAAILMRSYRWNRDRLFESYLANPEAVQKQCGLTRMTKRMGEAAAANHSIAAEATAAEPADCPFCGEEITAANSYSLGCDPSHRYCLDCWSNWVKSEMETKGPSAIFTHCPGEQCKEVLSDDVHLFLLPNKERRLLSRLLLGNYVDSSAHLRWCTNPSCSKVIRYTQGGARDIECACGARFCFACGFEESHSPCSCELVAKWREKNSSESENLVWLKAHTKQCPGCKSPIEKNSGCNHMTCKACKYQFCWLCKGEWSRHNAETGGFYRCNQYEETKQRSGLTKEEQSMEMAQAQQKRYQFYFERFMEYDKSIRSALKSIHLTESRMEQLQQHTGAELSSVEFLLDANKCVVECRRALKWSYALGYFLPKDSRQLSMFELDQGQLEQFSDELHGLIELPIEQLLPASRNAEQPPAAAAGAGAPSEAASPTRNKQPSPSAASSSSSSSTPASPSSSPSPPAPLTTLTGDDLRKYISKKTAVANKYLNNLVEAAMGGQYTV